MQISAVPTPWERLTAALVGDSGLVTQAGPDLLFGLVRHGGETTASDCPALKVVAPTSNNAGPIAAALAGRASSRDVGMASYALNRVHDAITSSTAASPNAVIVVRHSNTVYDLVCVADSPEMGTGDSYTGTARTYEEAQRITELGAPLFVVDFNNSPVIGDLDLESDKLAQIGGTGDEAYHVPPFDDGTANSELNDALEEIVRSATTCEFTLDGKVTNGKECDGTVTLDGRSLPCNDTNGWRLKNESAIELVGDSCSALRSSAQAQLTARFPCDVYLVI